MTNKLNEDELKKMSNFLHLNDTLRMLLDTHKVDEKDLVLDHLNSHFTFVRSLLMDLGVEFSEIEKIRSLNCKLRELEKSFSNPLFDNMTVSAYIGTEAKKFSDFFKNAGLGLRGSFSFKFTPDISAGILIYPAEELDENFTTFRDNFDLFLARDDKYYQIEYTQKNIDKIDGLIYQYFGNCAKIEYTIKSYLSEKTNFVAGISEVSIYCPVSLLSKAFSSSLNRR
jgi:hypothetical protein